jgi:hypothetical protein
MIQCPSYGAAKGHNLISTLKISIICNFNAKQDFTMQWPLTQPLNKLFNGHINLWDFSSIGGEYKGFLQRYVCAIKPLHFLRWSFLPSDVFSDFSWFIYFHKKNLVVIKWHLRLSLRNWTINLQLLI